MAGLFPAGVVCEIMKSDGTMARMPDLEEFGREQGIRIITIKDLIAHRRHTEKLVQRRVVSEIPVGGDIWRAHAYEDVVTGEVHLAMVLGRIDPERPVLLRAHSRCLTGDVFGSERCDCRAQLEVAMRMIAAEGAGIVLYLTNHEGRGIGL